MIFEEYCTSKKIDFLQFREEEPTLYLELEALFQHLHPESFTLQKKFLLNPLRRKYPLQKR